MRGTFRRDLALAPGPGFRLGRKRSATLLSAVLAAAAVAWGAYDLWAGHRVVGLATAALAVAFVVELVQGRLAGWRFEGAELRSRRIRVKAREIESVHVSARGGRARAWVATRAGEQVALLEGEEGEVRRIVDRLSGAIRLAAFPPGRTIN